MPNFLRFSPSPSPDGPCIIERDTLFQFSDDDLACLGLQCRLSLACIEDEIKRRKRQSPLGPSQNMWRAFQIFRQCSHNPSSDATTTLASDAWSEDKRQLLGLLGHQKLSQIPNSIFSRITASDKADIAQLYLRIWSNPSTASAKPFDPKHLLAQVQSEQPPGLSSLPQSINAELSVDSNQVAKLISVLGGFVTKSLLVGACQSTAWGPNGEIRLQKSLLSGVFESHERLSKAVRQLTGCGAMVETRDAYWMNPHLQAQLARYRSREYQAMALKALFVSFPKDSDLEPLQYGIHIFVVYLQEPPLTWKKLHREREVSGPGPSVRFARVLRPWMP